MSGPGFSTGGYPQGWPVGFGIGTVVGMRGWWQDLTDLVLPAECGGCGKPRTVLCPECRAALDGAAPSRVRPVPEPPGLPVVYAAARYADAVRAVLLAHKERGALGLAGPLGTALAGAVWAGVREMCEPGCERPAPGWSRRAWEGGCGASAGPGGELEGEPAERVAVGLVAARAGGVGAPVRWAGSPVSGAGGVGTSVGRVGEAATSAACAGGVGRSWAASGTGGSALAGGGGAAGVEALRGGGEVPGAEVWARGSGGPGAEVLGGGGSAPGADGSGRSGQAAGVGGSGGGGSAAGPNGLGGGGQTAGVGALGSDGASDVWSAEGLAAGCVPGGAALAGAGVSGGEAPAVVGGSQSGALGGGRWTGEGIGVPVLLVPVPSARRAVRARGHDPARRIALAAAGELRRAGMRARVVAVLRQGRGVADQAGLNSRQRLDNLAGALTVVPGGGRLLAEGLVVLVDDLMTTGASLTEAARAVREARARESREGSARENRAASARENLAHRGERMPTRPRDQRQQRGGERSGRRPMETGTGADDRRSEAGTRQGHRRPGALGQPVRGQRGTEGRHGERWQDSGGSRGGRMVAGCGDERAGLVYTAATREGMGERMIAVTEEDTGPEHCLATTPGAGRVRDVICAAVVAASPDSFEINRN